MQHSLLNSTGDELGQDISFTVQCGLATVVEATTDNEQI